MSNQRLLIILLMIGYVFAPTLFDWMMNPDGAWYRPFILWAGLILVVYLIQGRQRPKDIL